MKRMLTVLIFVLSLLVAIPYSAQAMPTLWEIQLHETFRYTTTFTQVHLPGSPYFPGTTVFGPTSQTTTGRFFLDSDFGAATSLSNISQVESGNGFHSLCGAGNCFDLLDAAGLFLGNTPHIVGLVFGGIFHPILEELSFDGWFTRASTNNIWDDPYLPPLPAELKTSIGPNEFVHRSADNGFRSFEFGTYTIRQVPEPSTLILFGVGLLALVVRFRKKLR